MIRRRWERYSVRLSEQIPRELRKGPRARMMAQSLAVLVLLDVNDWLISRFAADLPARWDPNVFPWAASVAAAWPDMRREVEEYIEHHVMPNTVDVAGLEPGSDEARAQIPTDVGIWRTVVLQWFGEAIEENARHFPSILRVAGDLGVTSIGLTGLDPRAHLAAHRGPNRGAVRYQLPIIVPGPPGACRIRVADEMIPWEEGRPIVFDLAVDHEVWNDTDEFRVLLMMEVPAPLPFPLSVVNRFAQRSFRFYPSFHAMRERAQALAVDSAGRRRA